MQTLHIKKGLANKVIYACMMIKKNHNYDYKKKSYKRLHVCETRFNKVATNMYKFASLC